ncbi:MAG: hypothetical protein ACYDHG_05590 [Desulfomonilaceae bacterium]
MRNRLGEALPDKKQDKAMELESLGIAAFVGKSLSDKNRLRILLSLCDGRRIDMSLNPYHELNFKNVT